MTNAKRALFFLLLCLNACSSSNRSTPNLPGPVARPSGQVVGNGGDLLRVRFKQARTNAILIVERMVQPEYAALLQPNLRAEELTLLVDHKASLLAGLRAGKNLWNEKLPAECPRHFCACAIPGEAADIHLASSECKKDAPIADIGELLVHEQLHHLPFVGADEDRADRIANAIYTAWLRSGHPKSPHWAALGKDSAFPAYDALWTGKEMVLWNNEAIRFFDPAANAWRERKPANPRARFVPSDWNTDRLYSDNQSYQPVWAANRIVAVGEVLNFNLYEPYKGLGYLYNPDENRWEVLKGKNRPADRRGFQTVSLGDRVLVWGGLEGTSSEYVHDSLIYDPKADAWTHVPIPEALRNRWQELVVWTGRKLIVWGGFGGNFHSDPLNSGAIYDPATGSWSAMESKAAPSGRALPAFGWTGKSLILYGGFANGEFQRSGAIYELATNSWRAINNEGAPTPREIRHAGALHQYVTERDAMPAAWMGTHLGVLGSTLGFYDPIEDRWTQSESLVSPVFGTHVSLFWSGLELLCWNQAFGNGYLYYP